MFSRSLSSRFESLRWYHILASFTLLATVFWVWGVFAFGKLTATWWGISIWPFAVLIIAAVVGAAWFFDFFDPSEPTPKKFLIFLIVFMFISVFEGVFISEPMLRQQALQAQQHQGQQQQAQQHDDGGSTFFYYSWWSSVTSDSSSSSHSSSSSSGKGAIAIVLVLVLIFLLIMNMFVPHLWVVSLLLSIVLLWLLAYKELQRANA